MTTQNTQTPSEATLDTDPYMEMVNQLKSFSALTAEISKLQGKIDEAVLAALGDAAQQFTRLQREADELEAKIAQLAGAHPEFFAHAKRLKMPFGEVSSTTTTSLVIPDEDQSIRLIRRHGKVEKLLKRVDVIRREVAETMPDDELAKLGIHRETQESIKVKAAKVSAAQTKKIAKQAKEAA